MIYTSYYAKVKTLEKHGIEPISISKGKPKWFRGRSLDCLAPTWDMLKMSEIDYNWNYSIILSKVRQCDVVDFLGKCDVALLCWEADLKECHRKFVGEWLRSAGYECEEFADKINIGERDKSQTLSLF